ncbi:hypothetical protein BH23CHL4_BH23CHL4_20710 [soil metagenome]
MIRLHSGRLFATVLAFFILLTGIVLTMPVLAQESSPESDSPSSTEVAFPEASSAASPVASPVASPQASTVAAEPYETSEFLSGAWRIAVVSARLQNVFTEFELESRPDKNWVVVIADITNWSRADGTLDPRNFAMEVPGMDDPRGFARVSTQGTAAVLGLQPANVDAGVAIDAGQTERVVLVFEIPIDVVNPALFIGGESLSLESAISGGPSFDALPGIAVPGETGRQRIDSIVNGNTIALGANAVENVLTAVDAPVGDECFSEQSEAHLRRIATERVFVERDEAKVYIWTEESDGTRRLLNFEQIAGGYAAAALDASGRFATWFADADESARQASGGLWEACTGPHGVTRTTAPERSNIRISDTEGGDTSYRVWLEWSPELVTTPDGGAWAFFSALADKGPLQDQQRLYASRFDPTQGQWLNAEPMPAGEIQFGPSAVVDSQGLVHVVYSAREFAGDDYLSTLLYTREDGRGGWVEPVGVSLDQLAGHQIAPSLAIDANDRLYVAWQDQRAFGEEGRAASPLNADIFVSQKDLSGAWTTPVLINNHLPTAAALLPRIVVDGDRIVAVWSIYTSALGPDNAARMEWASRALDADLIDWTAPQIFANGRGDNFGGRFVDMAADPNGGVVVAYARRGIDTFLFVKRLGPGAVQWGSDTLVAFGDRGSFPAIEVNDEGVVYVAYNAASGTFGDGSGILVDIGATAINYRAIEPGAEVILTRDDPNSQGRAALAIDLTGQPWFFFYGEIPGFAATQVGALRNANVPVAPISQVVGGALDVDADESDEVGEAAEPEE